MPSVQTLAEFAASTAQQDRGHGLFELESPYILELNLADQAVWTKTGSMIAYRGAVKFEREGVLQQGVGNFLKKMVSGEGARLTKAAGRGKVYVADGGKKVTLLRLNGDAICVNGNDLLAFEMALKYDLRATANVAAIISGGLFNVRVEGAGLVAITSHYQPFTLRVTPDNPLFTDPNATVAWSANLQPQFHRDTSLKTFLGRGSGESIQMLWQGDGFVVVQPYEEVQLASSSG